MSSGPKHCTSLEDFCTHHLYPRDALIRILMVGDVVGRPGRRVLKQVLGQMRGLVYPDFVTVNAENIAGGFGITVKIHDEMIDAGVDVLTMGNHWKDKPDVFRLKSSSRHLVLPQNLKDVDGVRGVREFAIRRFHRTALVLNLMGLFAMKEEYESPYSFLEGILPQLVSARVSGKSLVVCDVHAEASSEKQAVAWKLSGVAAMQIGTHTHSPTADERITPGGTAFVTDVGMTGPYGSIIGMDTDRTLLRYFAPDRAQKGHEVARGEGWFCGFLAEVDPATGLAVHAHRMQFRADENTWSISSVSRGGAGSPA
jgi:metallophosphoesterase (TIGR00282 family)